MKLLISGATGLVGSVLVKEARAKGHDVHFLSTRRGKLTRDKDLKGFYWNLKNKEIDVSCFEGVDAVIHLAGASISQRWTAKHKNTILTSRVDGTQLLVEGIRMSKGTHNIKKVIAASAIGIYPSSLSKVYTEAYSPSANSFLEKVVIDWEKAQDAFTTMGLNLVQFRIGLVLTPKGGVLGPLKGPTSLGLGAAFGSGKQFQSWIHVDDLVKMIFTALSSDWSGVFNAVSPNPVTQLEFIQQLAKAMNRPFFLPPLPRFLIRLIVGEMSTLIFNSQKVSAEKVIQKGFQFSYPTLYPALTSVLKN